MGRLVLGPCVSRMVSGSARLGRAVSLADPAAHLLNRCAPANTEIKNAVNVSAGSIALGEVSTSGICSLTCSAYPTFCEYSKKTIIPPNGVTARTVSRKITFFPPQIEVACRCSVQVLLSLNVIQ